MRNHLWLMACVLTLILVLSLIAIDIGIAEKKEGLYCTECGEELVVDGHIDDINYYHCPSCQKEYTIVR